MADLLLNKLVNGQISSKVLSKWLLHAEPENEEEFEEIEDIKVSQLSFVTFFLNFVHDQAPSDIALSATPQKLHNPKTAEKKDSSRTPDSTMSFKTALFPLHHAQRHNLNSSSNSDYQNGNHTSTPKNKNTSIRNCTFSPISPLSTSRKINSGDRMTPDRYKFSLEDFRVQNPRSSSKKKKRSEAVENRKSEASRRIKPTNICSRESNNDAFQKNCNSFSFKDSYQELAAESATEQRAVLAEEKANILLRQENLETNYCRPALFKRQCSPSKVQNPLLELVTYKPHLDNVIDVYKIILDHQLTLNITSEIYFLISLFLIKHKDQSKFCEANNSRLIENTELDDHNLGVNPLDSSDTSFKHQNTRVETIFICNSEIFHSVHNLVYFAITALETQTKIIQLYDKATIRLLAENHRVKEFAPNFSKKLITCSEENSESSYAESIPDDSQTNVCFNIDTDNQAIFPHQSSFHAFRKQRDLFYEILRIWEIHHLTADWNFANGLSGKISALFALHNGSANLMHLARLFKNQLLSSCAKGPKEKGLYENGVAFISSLRIDADKLNRLTNRLVTKEATNGINALPTFTGYQEFFKEFMELSAKYNFGMHLRDCIVFEILELNKTDFSGVGLDEEGNEVDVNARNLYANCIRNLRILAKFLGHLESLPYKPDTRKLPRSLVETQIEIRQWIVPALDVKSLLDSAIEKRTVVLIVPWLTKYLAMLDYITLRLPYYQALNLRLFRLYQNCERLEAPHHNVALVKFCLGWLFEMPHFPASEYLKFCSEQPTHSLNGTNFAGKCLDSMGIVNRKLLYMCCPYLDEMKKILASNAPGSKIAVKYITPVTAVASNTETTRKKLEQQLEDAFFSGQPSSLKRTVEFVCERVASTAIKFICQELVPLAKAQASTEWKDYLNSVKTTEAHVEIAQTKKLCQAQVIPVAQNHLGKFLPNCDEEVQKLIDIKISQSLDGLLPVDALEGIKQICVAITKKMCTERVKQWMAGHVNLTLFTKDFESEILKMFLNGRRKDKEKASFLLPPGGRDCSHNETAISGFHTVNNLREFCCKALENCDITATLVAKLLDDTYDSLTERNDLNDFLIVTLTTTLFDLYLLLVTKYPSIFTEKDMLAEFTRIWALHPKSAQSFKTLLAPRNVHILQSSKNTEESWTLYAKLVSSLLNNKFVDLDDLESQCTGFYNKDWDAGTLSSYSHFLKKLVSFGSGEGKEKFVYLLDFLSDFCSDL